MIKSKSLEKGLVVAIIFLFIGVAIAPNINANIFETDSELIGITTEVCGVKGVKSFNVMLTKQELRKLEELIDSFKERLEKVETREETIEVFRETIVSLDELGLLPDDISNVEAYQLVTGVEDINNPINNLSLVAGSTDTTSFYNPRFITAFVILYSLWINIADFLDHFLKYPYYKILYIIEGILFFTFVFTLLFNQINPILRRDVVYLGYKESCIPHTIHPAHGWVFSNEINGIIKRWEGSFWGNLPIESGPYWELPAMFGFRGIHIIRGSNSHLYLGCATWIEIAS